MSAQLPFDPIEEARRHWDQRWDRTAGGEMVAVTSIMRVHQILTGRLNELLEPFELTFPRYEALMLLHLSRRGSLPLGKIASACRSTGPASPRRSMGSIRPALSAGSPTSPTAARSSPRSCRLAARSPRARPRR